MMRFFVTTHLDAREVLSTQSQVRRTSNEEILATDAWCSDRLAAAASEFDADQTSGGVGTQVEDVAPGETR